MEAVLAVFLGAGLGGVLRHSVNVTAMRLAGTSFPYGTLAINVARSFAMGILVELLALKLDLGQTWRLFLTTGIMGGFTTFSAFSLESVLLVERGDAGLAGIYVLASVTLSISALFLGFLLIRQMT
jgi:CrcB protein